MQYACAHACTCLCMCRCCKGDKQRTYMVGTYAPESVDSEPFALPVRWWFDKRVAQRPFLNPPLLLLTGLTFWRLAPRAQAARRLKCRTLTPAGGIGNVTIVSAYHPPVMLIPSPTSSEALGRPHRALNFCIRRGPAAGGGGDEWPRRGNRHHRRSVSRGGRHIPDATRCLGRPAEPTSHAHPPLST